MQKNSDDKTKGPNKIRKGVRIVIAHAATEIGFLPDALLIFRAGTKNDDNKHYDKWFRTKIMPNLLENSVVVVGKEAFFNKFEDAAPTATAKRSEMEAWLSEKGISFNPHNLKPHLYKLICAYKDGYKKYKIDGILSEKNHPLLRYPGYHLDLNPIESVWTKIKSNFTEKSADKTIETVKQAVEELLQQMNDEMAQLCQQIRSIEDEYQQNDLIIDQLTDNVTVHVSEGSEDETDDDSTDGNDDESSSDEELVLKKKPEMIQCNISPNSILT